MRIFNLFRRKRFKPQPKQLRIDGVKTVLTAEPDDAELAAQALLESMSMKHETLNIKHSATAKKKPQQGTPEYYQQLSEKIRTAHEQERRMAMRYVSYVEEQLKLVQGSGFRVQDSSNHDPLTVNHEPESIATLERGLYQHQDTVERENGELLKRWQKCLAECLLLEMTNNNKNENNELNELHEND